MIDKETLKQKVLSRKPQSYWLSTTEETEYPALNEDIKADIAIIGGGMVGISCAYLLRNENLRIVILEADRILQGTTGHTTAKVTSQHNIIYSKIQHQLGNELARQYAEANESAIKLITTTTKELGINCDLVPQYAYVYTQEDKHIQTISDEVRAAADVGIAADYVEELPLGLPIKAAVRFANQAQFHPRKYLLALAKEITEKGISIFEESRIVDIEEDGPYLLTTQQGKKIQAKKVIIASHYPFYNKDGLYFSRIYTERSYVVAVKSADDYPGGMYISYEDPTRSLRSQSTPEGELILVGGENHKTGQAKDTLKNYEALIDFAFDKFKVEDIPYHWSTQDCMTHDSVPYVGYFAENSPNLYLATGYGKWGMTNSTASAMIIKDLILNGKSPWQDVYSPSRKASVTSAKSFIVENLNVAEKFIAGKLSPPDSPLNTTCTHMGCELTWNTAEKTWDCPCHGSRFSEKGDIIEGPAVSPLEADHDVNTVEKLIKDDF